MAARLQVELSTQGVVGCAVVVRTYSGTMAVARFAAGAVHACEGGEVAVRATSVCEGRAVALHTSGTTLLCVGCAVSVRVYGAVA